MKKISKILNACVFLLTTLAIGGVFYEGMELKWFSIVSIFIFLMDYSFLAATIVNLCRKRENRLFYIDAFSAVIIVIAYAMKFMGMAYPTISLVFWYFYIWFLYGFRVMNSLREQ